MVSRSLRSIACIIALGWEGVGCFLIFRVVIQSPRAQGSFCCPSCVCESNTGGSSAQEVPLGGVSAQFSGEENQEKESLIFVIWGFWLSLLLNYLQPGDYVFSDSLRYSPFGMGSVFLATRLPFIPGVASFSWENAPPKLRLASWSPPRLWLEIKNSKEDSHFSSSQ